MFAKNERFISDDNVGDGNDSNASESGKNCLTSCFFWMVNKHSRKAFPDEYLELFKKNVEVATKNGGRVVLFVMNEHFQKVVSRLAEKGEEYKASYISLINELKTCYQAT